METQINKLIIAGRTNWEKGFYIKFEAEEKSMKIIKKIVEGFKSEYFIDNQTIPKTFSKYEKWKDQWIPINEKEIDINIICGDKFIHLIVHKCPDYESVNLIIDKYSVFAQPEYKKGFSPPCSLK
jgi:hypothetical protein